ncbi:MAG: holin [Lachnospiraceae bacterium]|nr:holin [Lachnospiraceae bacterium]MDY4818363.1 holin [Lachnospiraceae bacterium]
MLKNNVFIPSVNTVRWMRAAGIRAVRTSAQTAVAMIPAAAMIQNVDWTAVVGTAALAGLVSILTSLAGIPEVKAGE